MEYYNIKDFSRFMNEKYNAKIYYNLQDAIKDFSNLFYCDDILHLTNFNIGQNDKYICYIFDKEEKMYIIVSYYESERIKEIFISDEFDYMFTKNEYNQIYSFLPFYTQFKENNSDDFKNVVMKYNGNFNEENVKKIFKSLYNATIVEDASVLTKLPSYQAIIEADKMLKEMNLSLKKENEKQILFHLEGENLYIPKEEKGCYVLTTFSNDKLISVWCSYNRFKWRYELENLIDINAVIKTLI